ncbi:MAG: IS630 family transposase [Pyrinomonadaceae bacterium]
MSRIILVELTADEREELVSIVGTHTAEARIRDRCRIILKLSDGASYTVIQKALGVARRMISKWLKRYLALGIDGLEDAPRSGRPRKYSLADEARVVNLACSKPEGGYGKWSQRRIAEKLGMSQTTVCRMLNRNELRPHKTEYWCGKSPDSEFEPKMQNVVGLYLNPPENSVVLSVDEKTQIQVLGRTQPELKARPGKVRKVTTTYTRHGTTSLIAALSVQDGRILAEPIERNDSATFLAFLKRLYREFPRKHLHVIADNLSVHKQKDVTEWVTKRKRITLHFTPTYSSWLNQIELFFSILQRDVLQDAIWDSVSDTRDSIMTYIDNYNNTRAAPFPWSYSG